MNGIKELEVDRSAAEAPVLSLLNTTDVNAPDAQSLKPGVLERQYVPSDISGNDENVQRNRSGKSRYLLGAIQFKHGPGLPRSHATIDLIITLLCFTLLHVFYLGNLDLTSHRTIAFDSSLLFIILFLSASGIYSTKRLRSLNRELSILLICWICAFAAVGILSLLMNTAGDVSRMWLTTSMLITLISLAGVRLLGCLQIKTMRKAKSRNVIICGLASSIKPVMRNLYDSPDSEVRVKKVFEFPAQQSMEAATSGLLPAAAQEMMNFIEDQRQSGCAVEQVWIAASSNQSHIAEILSQTLFDSSVDVCVVADQYTDRLLTGDVTRVGEVNIVNTSEIFLSPAAEQFKRVFDVLFASAALLVLCIPMLIIACLIKMESPGPALFRQKRYGIDGKEIEVLKFRSMCVHSDSQVRQATRNDARITRIGKILRRTSLDELPQFLNVLFGSMSLIGPRPHAVAHNEMWRKKIKGYMLRHKVRPGITGLAQVEGWRGETDTPFKMQQRVKFDLEYIRIWSPWLDIKIIFLTIVKGFSNKNAY